MQDGVVCVAAAGNDNCTDAFYPSDYESCISVISVDEEDQKSGFSNYGSQKDISAPGNNICSTYYTGGYAYGSGTSMAAPVISGVAALMLSAEPSLTVDDIKFILYSTAVDLGEEGKDDIFANGRVDAALAVEAAASDSVLDVCLNTHSLEMSTNGQHQLTAGILPATAANRTVTWQSSDEEVATVTDGLICGTGVGTAEITVTTNDGGYTDTCEVSVYAGPESVSLYVNEADIEVGESLSLTATVLPEDAADKTVTWFSTDTNVATVNGGVVTGVGSGFVTISVTTNDGGFTDTCTVNVTAGNIESDVYTADQTNSTLKGVLEKTSVQQLKNNLLSDPEKIYVYSADGSPYTGDAVATGMTVKRISGGITTDELTIIVKGDCSGDGRISITDYTLIRLDILKLKQLTGAFALAADVSGDGRTSITDYTLVRLHILELKSIV